MLDSITQTYNTEKSVLKKVLRNMLVRGVLQRVCAVALSRQRILVADTSVEIVSLIEMRRRLL